MTQTQVEKLVSSIVTKALAAQAGQIAKTTPKSLDERLAAKDKAIRSTFTKRGFKDVVLLDRTDPKKPFNVKPFKAWLAEGRVVRKGEKSVKGLFHITQTSPVETTAAA